MSRISEIMLERRCSYTEAKRVAEQEAQGSFAAPAGSAAWTYCGDALPPPDTDVETKIDDGKGVRNVCALRRHSNLWWFTDMSMYIYYSPTHWRPLPPNSQPQPTQAETHNPQ